MNTFMRPDTTYPRCETSHESVPAIGFTLDDQRQPGSNVPRPTVCPPICRTFACPLPSNSRTSSGESKLLTSIDAMSPPPFGVYAAARKLPPLRPAHHAG